MSESPEIAPAPARAFTVLVVDDDPSIRDLLSDVCEMEEYAVVCAEDGVSGLATLESHPEIDCVILDVMMPELSGLEVLERIRGRQAHEELPVILLTAAADDATTWEGWRQGASCYLSKPFEPEELLRHLSAIEHEVRTRQVAQECMNSEWLTEGWLVNGVVQATV